MSLPPILEPLRRSPEAAAVFLDFDGTLAPIVEPPDLARPLAGVPELLVELGARFGVVAVVSGRPAGFLAEHLGGVGDGVRLVGLYGLEEVGRPAGPTVDAAVLARWRPVMAGLAASAEQEAPRGVLVERKDVGFTLHFRAAPEHEGWVRRFVARAGQDGILVQEGRMALELRPGIATDKGTVVRTLGAQCAAACCFGDDLGDLAAFAALGDLAAGGAAVARVAVRDAESPPAVTEAADLVVEGPAGALELLRQLVAATR